MEIAKNPQLIDELVIPDWIVPIEPAGITLSNQALAIHRGKILDILPKAEARERYQPTILRLLPGHVLMPGLVNLHTHAAMTLLRGFADDLPLMRWLQERIWPAEGKHADAQFVHDGTLLACAEMLSGGITCFNDMYFFPEAAARAAKEAGIRANLGMVIIEFPTRYAADADDYIAKGLAARDALSGEELIRFCLAPHAPYTVSDRSFSRIATLSNQLDVPVHVHLHETRDEIEESLRAHGVRPLVRLQHLDLLGPQLIAVHAVHLEPAEMAQLARHGCHVAHCPTSNLKLASGIPDIAGWLDQGISVGLGTDGAASNNRLDVFHEMRHAALLAKGASGNAEAAGAHQVLRMATLGGAEALGMGELTGSLLPGKAADLCAVKLDDWLLQPCFDPASHLVYAAGREHVSHVWVAGKLRVEHGNPLQIDLSALREAIRLWHNQLTT